MTVATTKEDHILVDLRVGGTKKGQGHILHGAALAININTLVGLLH